MSRMTAAKPEIMKRHMALLEQRYDLGNRPAQGVKMSGGKAVQQGVRVKLASRPLGWPLYHADRIPFSASSLDPTLPMHSSQNLSGAVR